MRAASFCGSRSRCRFSGHLGWTERPAPLRVREQQGDTERTDPASDELKLDPSNVDGAIAMTRVRSTRSCVYSDYGSRQQGSRDSNPFDEAAGEFGCRYRNSARGRPGLVSEPSVSHSPLPASPESPESAHREAVTREGGGWSRAWQARRYGTGETHWRSCERAVDDAVAAYGVEWYTFAFPRNLSDSQTITFRRARSGAPGVRVDYWDLSELLAQLDEESRGSADRTAVLRTLAEEIKASIPDPFASEVAELEPRRHSRPAEGRGVVAGARRPTLCLRDAHLGGGPIRAGRTPGAVISHIEVDDLHPPSN